MKMSECAGATVEICIESNNNGTCRVALYVDGVRKMSLSPFANEAIARLAAEDVRQVLMKIDGSVDISEVKGNA